MTDPGGEESLYTYSISERAVDVFTSERKSTAQISRCEVESHA